MTSIKYDNCENLQGVSVTIVAATGLSEVVNTFGMALVGIQMPTAWTAALIGYNVAADQLAGTLQTAYDNGGNFEQTTVEASAFICIPQSDTVFAPFIQLKSVDSANAAVAQGADRVLTLVFRRYLGGR